MEFSDELEFKKSHLIYQCEQIYHATRHSSIHKISHLAFSMFGTNSWHRKYVTDIHFVLFFPETSA